MVYLILSPAFNIDNITGQKNYFELLKIGFSKDGDSWKTRFSSYKLHNPTCKILYEIPGLTSNDERTIQYKFRSLSYPGYGREWFNWSQEIIDFFEGLSKMSEQEAKSVIGSLLVPMCPSLAPIKSAARDFIQDNRNKLPIILARVLSSEELKGVAGVDNILLEAFQNHATDFPSLLDYLKGKYGESVVNEYLEREKVLESPENKEAKEFVEKYYSFDIFGDKIKFLCENPLLEEFKDIILSNIPDNDDIKAAYLILGPDQIRAKGYYNSFYIKKALGKISFSKESLSVAIYSSFSVGEKNTLVEFKKRLSDLYSSLSYKKGAMASDLTEYFEIKEVLLSIIDENGNKKRSRGYEILDYKRDSENFKLYQNYLMKDEEQKTSA